MKIAFFCIPLKKGALSQYEAFSKEHIKREKEYKDMLTQPSFNPKRPHIL